MTNNIFLQQMRRKKKPKQLATGNVTEQTNRQKKEGRLKILRCAQKFYYFRYI